MNETEEEAEVMRPSTFKSAMLFSCGFGGLGSDLVGSEEGSKIDGGLGGVLGLVESCVELLGDTWVVLYAVVVGEECWCSCCLSAGACW